MNTSSATNSISALQARMLKAAKLHSFIGYVPKQDEEVWGDVGESIVIEIPWYNADTKETGVDMFECWTMQDVSETLGY